MGVQRYPLVATSKNSGVTWTYTLTSTQIPADYSGFASFHGARCSGNICTVAGSYAAASNLYPLLAMSTPMEEPLCIKPRLGYVAKWPLVLITHTMYDICPDCVIYASPR